jgi:hypothetical protein
MYCRICLLALIVILASCCPCPKPPGGDADARVPEDSLTTALASIGFTRLAVPRPGVDAGTIVWLENTPAGLNPTILCAPANAYPGLGLFANNPTASQSVNTLLARQYSVEASTLNAIKGNAEYQAVDQISIRFTRVAVPEFAISDLLTARGRRGDKCEEAIRGQRGRHSIYVVLRAFRASVAYDVVLKQGTQAQLSVTALQGLASSLGVTGSHVSESSRSIEGDELTWGVAMAPLSTIENGGPQVPIVSASASTPAQKLVDAARVIALVSAGDDAPAAQLASEKVRILEDRVGTSAASPTCPGGERVFDGSAEITSDTVVACQKIVFRKGASLRVRNGAAVFFHADQILAEGHASIDGSGEPGQEGGPGSPAQGEWSSQGDADYWNAVRDCRNRPNHPDRGRQGGAGGRGGAGALIVLGARPEGDLAIRADGGPGGPGGPGSAGRLLKNGRQNYCDGCTSNCPGGPPGPLGPPGLAGRVITLAK